MNCAPARVLACNDSSQFITAFRLPPTMKFLVSVLVARARCSRATAAAGKDGFSATERWSGLAPKLLGILPSSPSNPAWARVAQPERIADKRKLIKDETDEALSEIFEHEAYKQMLSRQRSLAACCWFCRAVESPSSVRRSRDQAAATFAANLQWSDHPGKLVSGRDDRVFQ